MTTSPLSDDNELPASDVDAGSDGVPAGAAAADGWLSPRFVIPLAIVSIVVMIWYGFGGAANLPGNPRDSLQQLRKPDAADWRVVRHLAVQLRSAKWQHLKRDAQFGSDLAAVLEAHLDARRMDAPAVELRILLCEVLGGSQVPEALPALVRGAVEERGLAEVEVRSAAVQAIAVYAQNNDPATFRDDLSVMGPLLAASHERMRDDGSEPGRNELRSAAAFTLGVIGGDAALNRLRYLLGDSFPNVRYNAATALCRHGDVSALPVLLEMLDPESAACRAADSAKRVLVLTNGIRAASELAEKNATAGLEPLLGALRKIADGELAQFPSRVRREIHIHAKKSLRLIGGKSIALDSR